MAIAIGQSAPDFSLYDTDRKPRTLGEFKGKNVVLAFFPGAFTGVCTTEMCALRDRADQFNSVNAQVLGISVDSSFSQKAWAEQNNLNFPILSDFERKAVGQYDVPIPNFAGMEGFVAANRAVFIVDKSGNIAYSWLAPNPGVEPDYDEIKSALEGLS